MFSLKIYDFPCVSCYILVFSCLAVSIRGGMLPRGLAMFSGQDQYVVMLSGQGQYVIMFSGPGQYVTGLSGQGQYVI